MVNRSRLEEVNYDLLSSTGTAAGAEREESDEPPSSHQHTQWCRASKPGDRRRRAAQGLPRVQALRHGRRAVRPVSRRADRPDDSRRRPQRLPAPCGRPRRTVRAARRCGMKKEPIENVLIWTLEKALEDAASPETSRTLDSPDMMHRLLLSRLSGALSYHGSIGNKTAGRIIVFID